MIKRSEILKFAKKFNLMANIIEKDYILGWMLEEISNHADLSKNWLFKGGTCLKKCFFHDYRFSEDLDFTLKENQPVDEKDLEKQFANLADWIYEESGIIIIKNEISFEKYTTPRDHVAIQGRMGYQGAGISCFSPHKPENAKYNRDDPALQYVVGCPAGGSWITAEGLTKFGQWICRTCAHNPSFVRLLETYGQEFYKTERQVVEHVGGTGSSSAHFQVSLKTGMVVAVLSDQPAMAIDLNSAVQERLFYRQRPVQDPSLSEAEKRKAAQDEFSRTHRDRDTWPAVEEKPLVKPPV